MDCRKCLWCLNESPIVTFNKKAHTIPQSVGGTFICNDVCDACNLFFGSQQNGLPSIEMAIKETFGIARARFLHTSGKMGKNQLLPRYSSEYFRLDFKRYKIDFKSKFKLNYGFQNNLAHQLKRGIFKMYLEELHRQTGSGFDNRYNFIREFARYNLAPYPILYFQRTNGIILSGIEWVEEPRLIITEPFMKYLHFGGPFFEFELMGHVFSLPTTSAWEINFDNYIRESMKLKQGIFHNYISVEKFTDIDFQLTILNK